MGNSELDQNVLSNREKGGFMTCSLHTPDFGPKWIRISTPIEIKVT